MPNWETNPDYERLPQPAVGDIVHLKLTDGFQYLVKVLVTSVVNDVITGDIDAIFDYQTKAPITGGDVLQRLGKHVSFMSHFMQTVISNTKL